MLRGVYPDLVISDPNRAIDSGEKYMLKVAGIVLIVFVFSSPSRAQKGTAPNGFYPANYFGATFTGSLEAGVAADHQEITLVSTKSSKPERFVGRMESTCHMLRKDGSLHTFTASDLPKGTVLIAFYTTATKKSGGQKSTDNSVIAIAFVEVDGQEMDPDRKLLIPCSEKQFLTFKPFSSVTPGAVVPPN
jgi:hypothetical protein